MSSYLPPASTPHWGMYLSEEQKRNWPSKCACVCAATQSHLIIHQIQPKPQKNAPSSTMRLIHALYALACTVATATEVNLVTLCPCGAQWERAGCLGPDTTKDSHMLDYVPGLAAVDLSVRRLTEPSTSAPLCGGAFGDDPICVEFDTEGVVGYIRDLSGSSGYSKDAQKACKQIIQNGQAYRGNDGTCKEDYKKCKSGEECCSGKCGTLVANGDIICLPGKGK